MRTAKPSPAFASLQTHRMDKRAGSTATLLCLSSCSATAAPSLGLFGAFFPGWLACGIMGLLGGGISRAVMVATGLAEQLPFQLAVNASIGLIVALLAWLAWFGQ